MDYMSWPDYVILVAFLAISLGVGVYHSLVGGRQKTTSDFIMASRTLKVLPTAMSFVATFQSAIKILGITAEMYSYGSQYFIMVPLSFTLAMILTMQVVVPWMYPLKLVSVNEYLELRFKSKSVRIFSAIFSILLSIMHTGTVLYAPSAALEAASGLRIEVTIPVMAGVAIAYTALGGIRAVIWTDVLQCLIMVGGMIAILIKGLVVVGGFSNVFEFCSQSGRLNWVDWSPDPTVRNTIWGFLFGHPMHWFIMYGLTQLGAQRYMATKTTTQAKLSVGLNIPIFHLFHCTVCVMGLVVVSYYASIDCDPLANGEIRNSNQLLSHFVLKMFNNAPGFSGLFLATLYGGSLSSVSSSLSGAAANCWEDILQWKLKHWTDSRKVLLNRFIVVVLGIAACGMAFVVSVASGPVLQILIVLFGTVLGPTGGMFLLGGLNRHANYKGALIGGIAGIIGSLWLTFGAIVTSQRHPTLPPLSTDRCVAPNGTVYNLSLSDYSDINNSSSIDALNEYSFNATMMNFPSVQSNQTIWVSLNLLNRFYSISYLWYTVIWMLVTIFVGTVSSFLFRVDSFEGSVDERLLINFRECLKWRNNPRPDLRTEKHLEGEAKGEIEELVRPNLQLNSELTSPTPVPLKRTNEQHNKEREAQSDITLSK